jgi:PAS domain S-box-containing protein
VPAGPGDGAGDNGAGDTGRPGNWTENAYRSLFDQSGIGMVMLNAELRIADANKTFRTSTAEDVDGRDLFDLVRPDDPAELRGTLLRLTYGWNARVVRHVHARHRSEWRPARLTALGSTGSTPVIVLIERTTTADDTLRLTTLEARLLEGVAAGTPTVGLAEALRMTRQGVDHRVRAMLRKLRASNRPELISRAYHAGILVRGEWPPRVPPDYIDE